MRRLLTLADLALFTLPLVAMAHTITFSKQQVPEPATLALLGTGLMSTGFYLRPRRVGKSQLRK